MNLEKAKIFTVGGIALLSFSSWGCDYARMNDQESVRTYEKKVPRMDTRTIPVDPGYQFLVSANPRDLKNPLTSTTQTIAQGKLAYSYFCIQCHGPEADGKGTVGQSFAPLPSDLAAPDVQRQSDGELFSKILLGFGRHPTLYTTVSETDTWAIVNYLRTLNKVP
ncbi:MAG TPA: c-type cytochrome [Thermodesulfobacteriota bacterium]|nr:c-type cytochrome [Thermodesulfobacteriota bacterium]